MPTELARFVEELLPRYGTHQAIANAIGMTLSAFSRGVARGTLSTENLLQLAAATRQALVPLPKSRLCSFCSIIRG